MPSWLRVVSQVNPLSYQVDALRTLMIVGGVTTFGLGADFLMLLGSRLRWWWPSRRNSIRPL